METRYRELLNQRAALVAEGEALVAATEDGALSAEQREQLHALNARLDAINGELADVEALREHQRTVALARPASPAPQISGIRDQATDDPKRGFANLTEFAFAVRNAMSPSINVMDDRLRRIGAAPTNFHQETGGGPEGYLVPPEMRDAIWSLVFGGDDIIDFISPEETSSNAVEQLVTEVTPWGVTGVQAAWRSEGTQMTPSRTDLEARLNRVYELYAFVLATRELLQDAPRLNGLLTREASQAIRWKVSDAFMRGSGAGQPQGWLTAAATVTQNEDGVQGADTINATNVLAMYARSISGQGRFWLINPDALPQLAVLMIGDRPMLTQSMAPGPALGMLLGLPVYPNDHCATLGDLGDIQLISPAGYQGLRHVSGLEFASSIHLYFDYNIEAFRWITRFGGQPYLSAPVTPPNSALTRSHFVLLQARA